MEANFMKLYGHANEYRMEAGRAYSGKLAEGEQEAGGVMMPG
jgi:hypothetical protein